MNAIVAEERLLTESDYARLSRLGPGPLTSLLAQALDACDLVAADAVPGDLVTMHSEVEVRDAATDRLQRLRLCYPGEADAALGHVSVLSPIGAALLGRRAGALARWVPPAGGERSARIERVAFQPEAGAPRAA